MSTPTEKFINFIQRQVQFADEEETECCGRILLMQFGSDASTTPLHTMRVKPDPAEYDEDKIVEMAEEFLDTAQADADSLKGVTSYVLVSFTHPERRMLERSPVVRMRSSTESLNGPLEETESATVQGHMAQMMRHNEQMMRITVGGFQHIMNHFERSNQILSEQANEALGLRVEYTHKVEELNDKKHEREMDQLQLVQETEQKERVFALIQRYAPLAIAKLTGKPVVASDGTRSNDPNLEAIKEIITNLPQEKVEQMMGVLGEDAVPLVQMYMAWQAEKDKEDEGSNGAH